MAAQEGQRLVPAVFSRCTVGTQWLSVNSLSRVALYRIMPSPPPWKTLWLFRMRFRPRWQTTISFVSELAGIGLTQSASVPTAVPSTTGRGVVRPAVIDEPTSFSLSPLLAVSFSSLWKCRSLVLAATVVTHGPRWSVVSGPGPSVASRGGHEHARPHRHRGMPARPRRSRGSRRR